MESPGIIQIHKQSNISVFILKIHFVNRKFNSYRMLSFLMMLFLIVAIPAHSQERIDSRRSKNIFVEFGGSGIALMTANYDFRFLKNRSDGLGMRIGIGGESSKSESFIGTGETKTKLFTIPLELNYVLSDNRFSFEIGYSLTYINQSESSSFRLIDPYNTYSDESGKIFVSYVPVGFRLKPKEDGFMLKFNLGPLVNYSAPNLFNPTGVTDGKIQAWIGFAAGYSFY